MLSAPYVIEDDDAVTTNSPSRAERVLEDAVAYSQKILAQRRAAPPLPRDEDMPPTPQRRHAARRGCRLDAPPSSASSPGRRPSLFTPAIRQLTFAARALWQRTHILLRSYCLPYCSRHFREVARPALRVAVHLQRMAVYGKIQKVAGRQAGSREAEVDHRAEAQERAAVGVACDKANVALPPVHGMVGERCALPR